MNSCENKSPESIRSVFHNSRRNFLKTLGAFTLGGISSFVLPSYAKALSKSDKATGIISPGNSKSYSDETYWENLISGFALDKDIIYMNTGTEGAMTESVVDSLSKHTKEFTKSPMYSIGYNDNLSQTQKKNREKIAGFIGADADEIVLTTNTTEGLHLAINGLDFNKDDEIITTLHDHHAATSPIYILRDRRGVRIRELAIPTPANDKQLILDIFERSITKKTRAFCICHINFTTGLRMPVKEICDLAKSRGIITIVDGAHAIGAIDFNLHELGCDFYACPGHKWLNGPPGTGIFYVRDAKNNPHSLWPVLTEVYQVRNRFPVTNLLQMRGQMNTPALAAMIDAMELQKTIGKKHIEARVLYLNKYLKEKIIELWGRRNLLTPDADDNLCSGIASFIPFNNFEDRFNEIKYRETWEILRKKYNIYIRYINFRNRESDSSNTNALRISTHIFNSIKQIDRVVNAIKSAVAEL
jgi:selenocysteine lyase/cysteine desulfurase